MKNWLNVDGLRNFPYKSFSFSFVFSFMFFSKRTNEKPQKQFLSGSKTVLCMFDFMCGVCYVLYDREDFKTMYTKQLYSKIIYMISICICICSRILCKFYDSNSCVMQNFSRFTLSAWMEARGREKGEKDSNIWQENDFKHVRLALESQVKHYTSIPHTYNTNQVTLFYIRIGIHWYNRNCWIYMSGWVWKASCWDWWPKV